MQSLVHRQFASQPRPAPPCVAVATLTQDTFHGTLKLWPLVTTVGIELQQEWIHAEQCCHHQNATFAILDVGRMHDGMQKQTQRVYKEMALLTFDLLASVVAMGIDAAPPFSALLTL
jgi:hypothetical protein